MSAGRRREARRPGGADLRTAVSEGLRAGDVRREDRQETRRQGDCRALDVPRDRSAEDARAGRGARTGRRMERSSSPTASACASSAAPTKPDADTLFMIASNTKALTTLMLAKLVDEGKIHVGDPGDDAAAVVQAGRRRHHEPRAREALDLRVHGFAAAGFRVALPIQGRDLGRCAEDAGDDAADDASSARCSRYSNPLAGAAGFVGGHVAFPTLALGGRLR